jgi:hypothetical protein
MKISRPHEIIRSVEKQATLNKWLSPENNINLKDSLLLLLSTSLMNVRYCMDLKINRTEKLKSRWIQ